MNPANCWRLPSIYVTTEGKSSQNKIESLGTVVSPCPILRTVCPPPLPPLYSRYTLIHRKIAAVRFCTIVYVSLAVLAWPDCCHCCGPPISAGKKILYTSLRVWLCETTPISPPPPPPDYKACMTSVFRVHLDYVQRTVGLCNS